MLYTYVFHNSETNETRRSRDATSNAAARQVGIDVLYRKVQPPWRLIEVWEGGVRIFNADTDA